MSQGVRTVVQMGSPWSPWAEVTQLQHVHVRLVELPEETGGAALVHRGRDKWILIDRRSTPAERRSRLAHELIHLERGETSRATDAPRSWDDVVVREETIVDREVARRLVPLDRLQHLVNRLVDLGEPVGAATVMDEFNVPIDVAHRALWLLTQHHDEQKGVHG